MTPTTLLKIGGSLITHKAETEALRPKTLQRLCEEVARSLRRFPKPLILGHGSGSFGHRAASEAKLSGTDSSRPELKGISRTQHRARLLHHHVLGALIQANLAPFSSPPGAWALTEDHEVVHANMSPLISALEGGFLPVVMGDVILDKIRGGVIASTEKVLLWIEKALRETVFPVTRVLWVGNTTLLGPDGTALSRLDPSTNIEGWVGGAQGSDVTGGMVHRVESARVLAARGIESWIIDGTIPDNLERALDGQKPLKATRID